mmetsp:Transcript_66311/g.184694  ORF Transcript_66311/g.184694 Transcript_66311/m.184694 type:complete len:262 (+) Transcript_66311:2250-3035(+)
MTTGENMALWTPLVWSTRSSLSNTARGGRGLYAQRGTLQCPASASCEGTGSVAGGPAAGRSTARRTRRQTARTARPMATLSDGPFCGRASCTSSTRTTSCALLAAWARSTSPSCTCCTLNLCWESIGLFGTRTLTSSPPNSSRCTGPLKLSNVGAPYFSSSSSSALFPSGSMVYSPPWTSLCSRCSSGDAHGISSTPARKRSPKSSTASSRPRRWRMRTGALMRPYAASSSRWSYPACGGPCFEALWARPTFWSWCRSSYA